MGAEWIEEGLGGVEFKGGPPGGIKGIMGLLLKGRQMDGDSEKEHLEKQLFLVCC